MSSSTRFVPSKIRWHSVEQHGYPPKFLRQTQQGLDRVFIVMTDEGLKASAMFGDGSGFADLGSAAPISWAFDE